MVYIIHAGIEASLMKHVQWFCLEFCVCRSLGTSHTRGTTGNFSAYIFIMELDLIKWK